MRMGMVCEVRQSQRLSLEQILKAPLLGGAADSIFPKVERRLQGFSTLQHGLAEVKGAPDVKFRCFLDLLLCATFPEITPLCVRYYEEKGLPLRKQITSEGRDTLEILLLGAMEAAYIYHQHHLPVTWGEIRRLLWISLDLPPIRLFPEGVPDTPLYQLAAEAA